MLILDGAGSSLFFLLYFATDANLCWCRLARAPRQSLFHAANQGHAHASNFPVSLLSLLGGVDCVVLQLQLHGVWLFLPSEEQPAAPFEGKKGFPPNVRYRRYLPSFPTVSVRKIPRKYQLIPYQNTESGCNSTLFPFLVFHYLNGLFQHIFLNVLSLVHVPPPPIITYLNIH